MHGKENRLAGEASLYLRQHARNPVDWYPWGEEAVSRARGEEKPVFLSVGYAACHWCHVMEHEVFEDETVARILNEHFVSIKVDREDRPDIDAAYMEALQALTGGGGWPMSLFLTPGLKPFFGATYIPRDAFLEIATRIARVFAEERQTLEERADQLHRALSTGPKLLAEPPIDHHALEVATERALAHLDDRWGGIAGRMKFPTPPLYTFLLHRYRKTGDERCARAVRTTLDSMSSGGIHDHLGGGFHRYAVEETWLIPHFEKMLYDNAQLASLYLEAAAALAEPKYAAVARDTLDFMLREMVTSEGGFCASFDADSDGVEGACYLWTRDEILEVAGSKDGPALAALLGVTASGNFEGQSILTQRQTVSETAASFGRPEVEIAALLDLWRPALLERRGRRAPPTLDHKVVTSWNGLAVAALARAYAMLGDERYLAAAQRAADHLWRAHRGADGGLHRSSTEGKAQGVGVLNDYANLIRGLLELFQVTAELGALRRALELTDRVTQHFASSEGGYHMTPEGSEAPLGRQVDILDGVRPSGNASMLHVLLRLSALQTEPGLCDPAVRALEAHASLLRRAPLETAAWFDAAQGLLGPRYCVVIAGERGAPDTRALAAAFGALQPPHAALVCIPPAGPRPEVAELLPCTMGKGALGGNATAFVCTDRDCKAPTRDPEELRRQILEGWAA